MVCLLIDTQSMHPPKKRLLDQVRERMWLKNKANQTEESYLYWIDQYILFHNKSHLNEMGAQRSSNPSPIWCQEKSCHICSEPGKRETVNNNESNAR